MAVTILCDTSVVVAAHVTEHPHYVRTLPLIEKVLKGRIKAVIPTHSLAECFSTLTTIPAVTPIGPLQAMEMIRSNILKTFQIVDLTLQDYEKAIERVARLRLKSGAVYDALIFEMAVKKKVSHLVTWDEKDFRRLSEGEVEVVNPEIFDS